LLHNCVPVTKLCCTNQQNEKNLQWPVSPSATSGRRGWS
jgi:hypothetical protein